MSTIAGFACMVCLLCRPVLANVTIAPPVVTRADGVTLLTQSDPTTGLIGTELFVPAGLNRQSSSQSGLAALVAECIVQTPVALRSGQLLAVTSIVRNEGGALSYAVDGREVRFYLEGLSGTYSASLLPAFRRALTNPDFSADTIRAARAALRDRIGRLGASPVDVGMEMLGQTFAVQLQFGSEDARAFYAAHYRRDGAVVSAIGDVSTLGRNDLRSLASALSPGSSQVALVRTAMLSGASRRFVAHRDLPVPWLVAQYRAPALNSRDFGAMLVISAFLSRTLLEVAQIPAISTSGAERRSTGAIYAFGNEPASLSLFIGGGLGDPERALARTLAATRVLQRADVRADMDDLKAAALGFFADSTGSLEERARLAAIFMLRGASPDYWSRVSEAISATTAGDVQRVANRYLVSPTIAQILPRAAPAPQ